jgi:hypothetical protein
MIRSQPTDQPPPQFWAVPEPVQQIQRLAMFDIAYAGKYITIGTTEILIVLGIVIAVITLVASKRWD